MALVSQQESLADKPTSIRSEVLAIPAGLGKRKAELWESICAIDRTTSMMWSLPLATKSYPLPKHSVVDFQGQVSSKAYQYRLVDIASRVLELDDIYSSGKPLMELLDAVLSTDRELRSLASLTPQNWWRIDWPVLSMDALLQFWHHYITIRTHLQLALKHDENQQFSFNFITCFDACQELARRYVALRPVLPAGFFANWVIDLQHFTAIVFLLLASYRTSPGSGILPQPTDVNISAGIVDQALQTMHLAADRVGGDCARQAADATRSLRALLHQSQPPESQKISLSLPLVGRIHVSRKSHATKIGSQPHPVPNQPLQAPAPWQTATSNDGLAIATAQTLPYGSSDLNSMGSLDCFMEIPDSYSFLTDEIFGADQWLTTIGTESNH